MLNKTLKKEEAAAITGCRAVGAETTLKTRESLKIQKSTGNNTTILTAIFALVVLLGACKKDTQNGQFINGREMKAMGNYQQPTQNISIATHINVGTAIYPVIGHATAGSYDGRIYDCKATWNMEIETETGMLHYIIILEAGLKPEFDDITIPVVPIMENYEITINGNPYIPGSAFVSHVDSKIITISHQEIADLWGRMLEVINANVVIIDITPIIITNNFSSIDFSKFNLGTDGMLEFESFEDYAQTIDALLEVCNQYSNKYLAALETQLGCSIDEVDESIVAAYVTASNFFPFNPLMDFIGLIGFTNSAYPVLRTQEIEWMANETRFETEENPFDAAEAGYVQSALHNKEGFVKIKTHKDGGIIDFKGDIHFCLECMTPTPCLHHPINPPPPPQPTTCKSDAEQYKDSPKFAYEKKNRVLKGLIRTHEKRTYGKTGCYKKTWAGWILWTNTVSLKFEGTKSLDCPANTRFTGIGGSIDGSNSSWTGLTEKYDFHGGPTYLTNNAIFMGVPIACFIMGTHKCSNYSGIVTTVLNP